MEIHLVQLTMNLIKVTRWDGVVGYCIPSIIPRWVHTAYSCCQKVDQHVL